MGIFPQEISGLSSGRCERGVKVHLKSLDVRDSTLKTEAQLLLERAGKHKQSWKLKKENCSVFLLLELTIATMFVKLCATVNF